MADHRHDQFRPCTPCDRRFPVQGDRSGPATEVPWWVAEAAYVEYARRYRSSAQQQSLVRMAERGGFGRTELLDLIAGGNGAGDVARERGLL